MDPYLPDKRQWLNVICLKFQSRYKFSMGRCLQVIRFPSCLSFPYYKCLSACRNLIGYSVPAHKFGFISFILKAMTRASSWKRDACSSRKLLLSWPSKPCSKNNPPIKCQYLLSMRWRSFKNNFKVLVIALLMSTQLCNMTTYIVNNRCILGSWLNFYGVLVDLLEVYQLQIRLLEYFRKPIPHNVGHTSQILHQYPLSPDFSRTWFHCGDHWDGIYYS